MLLEALLTPLLVSRPRPGSYRIPPPPRLSTLFFEEQYLTLLFVFGLGLVLAPTVANGGVVSASLLRKATSLIERSLRERVILWLTLCPRVNMGGGRRGRERAAAMSRERATRAGRDCGATGVITTTTPSSRP